MSVDIDDLIKRLFWAGPEGVAVTQDEARELYLLAFASYDDDLRDDRDELNQQIDDLNDEISELHEKITALEDEIDAGVDVG